MMYSVSRMSCTMRPPAMMYSVARMSCTDLGRCKKSLRVTKHLVVVIQALLEVVVILVVVVEVVLVVELQGILVMVVAISTHCGSSSCC